MAFASIATFVEATNSGESKSACRDAFSIINDAKPNVHVRRYFQSLAFIIYNVGLMGIYIIMGGGTLLCYFTTRSYDSCIPHAVPDMTIFSKWALKATKLDSMIHIQALLAS